MLVFARISSWFYVEEITNLGRDTKSCAYKNQQGIRAAIILYAACIVCAVKEKKIRGAHTKKKIRILTIVFYSILCSAKKGVKIEGFKEHTKEKIRTVFYALVFERLVSFLCEEGINSGAYKNQQETQKSSVSLQKRWKKKRKENT